MRCSNFLLTVQTFNTRVKNLKFFKSDIKIQKWTYPRWFTAIGITVCGDRREAGGACEKCYRMPHHIITMTDTLQFFKFSLKFLKILPNFSQKNFKIRCNFPLNLKNFISSAFSETFLKIFLIIPQYFSIVSSIHPVFSKISLILTQSFPWFFDNLVKL